MIFNHPHESKKEVVFNLDLVKRGRWQDNSFELGSLTQNEDKK